MRRHTRALSAAEDKRGPREHWVYRATWLIGAISGMGMLTWSAALGSHLTLPGSQDLHHSQRSDTRSFIHHLKTINNYIPPDSLSNPKVETIPVVEKPAVTPMPFDPPLVIEPEPTPSPPSQLIPITPTKKNHGIPTVLIRKNSAQGHADMGWTFLLDGRPQAALAAYREALRHHPHSAAAFVGMGITLKSLGDVEPARQAIQQALELNPQLSSALVHLGYLYADGHVGPSDLKTARHLFDEAFQLGDPFAGIALLDLQTRSHSKL